MNEDREFDIVVYGATGFTGKLVVEYLCRQYICKYDGTETVIPKIAIAGRNREKLEAVKKSLHSASSSCECSKIEILVSEANDPSSLINICTKTKVIISTVGPYLKYGEELISACIAASTHYCNISGEIQFAANMIKKYGKDAIEKKIKLVNFCGFDSIPSDLSVLLLENKAIELLGMPVENVRLGLTDLYATVSGGTINSLITILDSSTEKNKNNDFVLCSSYEKNVDDQMKVVETPQTPLKFAGWDKDFGYTSYFSMREINENVVRYSNYLQQYKYGEEFRYMEFLALKRYNYFTCRIEPFFIKLIFTALKFRIPRWLLTKFVLPKPGEGPSRKNLDSGHFRVEARGEIKKDGTTYKFLSKIGSIHGDAGYKETAKMVSESALCLALDFKKCTDVFGICTPASGIGTILADRLKAAGFTIDVSYTKE